MNLPQLPHWRFFAFPELTWLPKDSSPELPILAGTFVTLSLLVPLFALAVAAFLPNCLIFTGKNRCANEIDMGVQMKIW